MNTRKLFLFSEKKLEESRQKQGQFLFFSLHFLANFSDNQKFCPITNEIKLNEYISKYWN